MWFNIKLKQKFQDPGIWEQEVSNLDSLGICSTLLLEHFSAVFSGLLLAFIVFTHF